MRVINLTVLWELGSKLLSWEVGDDCRCGTCMAQISVDESECSHHSDMKYIFISSCSPLSLYYVHVLPLRRASSIHASGHRRTFPHALSISNNIASKLVEAKMNGLGGDQCYEYVPRRPDRRLVLYPCRGEWTEERQCCLGIHPHASWSGISI